MRHFQGEDSGSGVWRQALGAGILALFLFPAFSQEQPGAAGLNQRGVERLQQGDAAKALEYFQAAAKQRPDDPAVQFNIGLALLRLERLHEALDPLEKALAHPPSRPRARYLRGVIFFQLGAWSHCAQELEHVREDSQQGEHILYMLVESYRKLGEVERAQQAFEELMKRYPAGALGHKLMAVAYDSQERYEEAIREFQAALRVDPRMPEAAFGIGYIHWKRQNYGEALRWLEKELEVQPCYAPAHYYLGEIARRRREWGNAVARYERAVECDPQHGGAYLGLGDAYEKQGSDEKALAMFRKAAERQPEEAEPHYRLARVLRRLGKEEEARTAFERVREIREAERAKAQEILQSKPQ